MTDKCIAVFITTIIVIMIKTLSLDSGSRIPVLGDLAALVEEFEADAGSLAFAHPRLQNMYVQVSKQAQRP